MPTLTGAKTAKVTLSPQNQTIQSVNALVESIISRSGCRTCGRLINLNFAFQGDPDPDFAKSGAIAVETEGF